MKTIKKGIVFSEDINRILNGINAYDYKYEYIPSIETIKRVRENFITETKQIFKNITMITEEEMLEINNLIGGGSPHCYSR